MLFLFVLYCGPESHWLINLLLASYMNYSAVPCWIESPCQDCMITFIIKIENGKLYDWLIMGIVFGTPLIMLPSSFCP